MFGDLREGPVAAQVKVHDLALVVGEERAVPLVESECAAARLKGVKGHALTAYQVF